MALGFAVDKNTIDQKSASVVLDLRKAFEGIETMAKWLANNPVVNSVDPLVSEFEYTTDEAYVLRLFFETFETVRTANDDTFQIGRKITGLAL